MIRIAMHVIGVTACYVAACYGVGAIAGHLGGVHAESVARTTSAMVLLPFWGLGLALDRRSP